MGKVLKIALVVAAVAVNVIPGVGQAVSGAIVGALGGTFSALSVAVTAIQGITALGLAAGLGMASKALGLGPKSPSISSAAASRLNATLVGTTPRTIVYGRTALATDIRYQAYTGADQEYYHQIIVCASHAVQSIEEIWIEEQQAWSSGGGVTSAYSGYLQVDVVLEGSASNMIDIDGVWNAANNRRLTGCAYVHIRYKLTGNSKKAESPFSSTVPNRLTIIGRAMKVYDPRRDSTVGGSGSMRAADQSTWAWSVGGDEIGRNPALVELNYLLGWRINGKLAVGRGIPPNRIDMASFIESANLCNEPVTLAAGGTEPRYRFDGIFSEGDDGASVRGAIETSMNAVLRDGGGRLSLSVLHNDLSAPVISFTEDDVIGPFSWEQTAPISDDRNVVRGRYTSPAALYQMVDYPQASIDSGDGIDRILSLDLPCVQSIGQAQRLAKQQVQRLKYLGTFTAPFNAKGWAAQVGKIVSFSFAPLGWANMKFRVAQQTVQPDGVCELVLQIENPAIYAWDAEESPALTLPTPTRYDYLNNPLLPSDWAYGVNQFANSAFRFGPSQWGKPWAGEVGNGVLTWSDGKLLLSSPAPAPGADAGFCSVSAYDGGSLRDGWHLFEVQPGQRIAVRVRGAVSRTNAHFRSVFRFYDNPASGPIVEAVGTAFPGYSRELSSDAQEAAYYVDVPAGSKWLWAEFYGISVSSGDSVTISLESMLLAYIDPAQTIPPVWNEGPTGAYRADVTGENTALDTLYIGGVPVSTVLSNIDTALYDAANAQATADGKIDTFYQPSPPAGSLGDLWFDTDDGNKLYRHNGSSWVVSQDGAIATAITAAAGAQATADGKVTTFIGASTPTPSGVGDLWSNSTTHVLYRWSGSAWQEVAKLGADGINALGISCQPTSVTVPCLANGTPKAAVPGFQITTTQAGVDVSASAAYGAVVSSGMSGAAVDSDGTVTVSGMTADTGYVAVPISHGGATATARVEYSKSRDGAAYTADEDVTISTPGTSYGEVARNVLLAGPNGTLQLAWNVSAIVTGGSSAGMDGYLDFSLDGSSWSTVSGTSASSGSFPPGEGLDAFASTSITGASVSLTVKQNIYVRLMMRRTGGGGLGSVTGSLQTQWNG